MLDADMIIVQIQNNSLTVSDYFSNKFGPPELDTTNNGTEDLTLLAQDNSASKVVLFKRKLHTNDNNDKDFVVGKMDLLWAKGNTNELSYHGTTKGEVQVDFSVNV